METWITQLPVPYKRGFGVLGHQRRAGPIPSSCNSPLLFYLLSGPALCLPLKQDEPKAKKYFCNSSAVFRHKFHWFGVSGTHTAQHHENLAVPRSHPACPSLCGAAKQRRAGQAQIVLHLTATFPISHCFLSVFFQVIPFLIFILMAF